MKINDASACMLLKSVYCAAAGARQDNASIAMRAMTQTHRENGFFDHIYVDASVDTRDPIALTRTNMRQRGGGDAGTATDLCTRDGLGRRRPSLSCQRLAISLEA